MHCITTQNSEDTPTTRRKPEISQNFQVFTRFFFRFGRNSLYGDILKADSHIACHAHAAPITFPCHAVPLRV